MAENVIFAEQTLSLASGVCTMPAYYPIGDYSSLIILWGETEYTLSPVTIQEGAYYIGNGSLAQMGEDNLAEDTGEPFLFLTMTAEAVGNDTGLSQVQSQDLALTSINFAIKVAEEEPEETTNIVLRDRNGEEVVYKGVEKVKFNTDDGGTQLYSKGDTVENMPIILNFSGGSSETVIFAEQTLSFVYSEDFGAYFTGFNTSPFSLVDGQEYIVVWDGIENKRTAFAFTNPRDGSSCVALGNPLAAGGAANEDKFAIVEDKTNGYAYFFSLETTAEHTVKIYQETASFGDQVVKAPSGYLAKSVVIEKPETLVPENIREGETVAGVTGTLPAYTLEDKTVELDFSGGDMTVEAEEKKPFKNVTIRQPENLIPENIAEGVDIAGIIGEFAKNNMVCACGSFSGTTNQLYTLEHNMGVVPDFIMIYSGSTMSGSSNYYIGTPAFALSEKAKELSGYSVYYGEYTARCGSSGSSRSQTQPLTYPDSTKGWASQADETSIVLGLVSGSVNYGFCGTNYWFAFGGLT